VHAAAAYAKQKNRLQTWAVTSSIGPGATNMVTGAALATTNRLPVLLLPSDIFSTRARRPGAAAARGPALARHLRQRTRSRPVSRFWDRINRPEQLASSMLNAMRVLTDPVETGAVTICLPQDVQPRRYDFPVELFRSRVWHIGRPVPEPAALRSRRRCHQGVEAPAGPWQAAASSTPAPRRRCARSPMPRASRSPTRRPARAPSTSTTGWRSGEWARQAAAPRTRWPARLTW